MAFSGSRVSQHARGPAVGARSYPRPGGNPRRRRPRPVGINDTVGLGTAARLFGVRPGLIRELIASGYIYRPGSRGPISIESLLRGFANAARAGDLRWHVPRAVSQ